MRDGANQATKGTLRASGNLGPGKNGRYRVKLVQVAAAPQLSGRIRARILGTKRGDQRGPAGDALSDFFAVFRCTQRTIFHGFLF
jgi:hypothetical protein